MNPTRRTPPILVVIALALVLLIRSPAAEAPAPASAPDLASRLSALYQNGSTYVRARMEIQGATKETLQLQIKQRRTKTSTDILYQVLFPKDRKGESVLLRKTGDRPASGLVFTPPATVRPVESMKSPLLGSDLTCEDIVENFFAWDSQAIAGTAVVDGVNCTILESKPGKGERSSYGSVRTWVDTRRTVPLRVEKYSSSGQLLRRIDTTRVVPDAGNHIPANLVVHGARPNLTTELEGSRIRHDVTFTDADFSEEGLKQMSAPRGSGE
jgi:outer membrane lipoprotein-sorting protein